MSERAYTLRPEYEGTLVGGTVVTGSEGGMLNVVDALDEGDGKIVTDDLVLQSVLENYYGEFGLVFVTNTVEEDGSLTPLPEAEIVHQPPHLAAPGLAGQEARREAGLTAGSVPSAQHDESQSAYDGLTVPELEDTARERGLEVKAHSKKSELIEALEANDAERE
jgi:hypothetical protein